MANDMKTGIGFLIPATAVVGFFTSLIIGEYLISIIVAVLGILAWFVYMLVMESHIPKEMGNMIILFGILLSLGIFFGFGVRQNMWGGMELESEGAIFSLVILFFAILTGLNFRNQQTAVFSSGSKTGGLSDEDRELVVKAISNAQESKDSSSNEDSKVIIVKQESKNSDNQSLEEEKQKQINQISPNDPYGMANNPYFAYPPDYYYDEEDDDEYEDEWEEDDEWEEGDD